MVADFNKIYPKHNREFWASPKNRWLPKIFPQQCEQNSAQILKDKSSNIWNKICSSQKAKEYHTENQNYVVYSTYVVSKNNS